MNIEAIMNRKKNFSDIKIKTLDKRTQVIYNWCGAYDMIDGSIHIGCDEDHITSIIWHEIMHKILFEQISMESNKFWDNIADEIQYFIFNITPQDMPYIFTSPPAQAKTLDADSICDQNAGKRKTKEKSIITGWKPQIKKRIPPRKHTDLEESWQI